MMLKRIVSTNKYIAEMTAKGILEKPSLEQGLNYDACRGLQNSTMMIGNTLTLAI